MGISFDDTTTPNNLAPRRTYKSENRRRKWRQSVTESIGHDGTSVAPRPGWTVMGSCHSHKNLAVLSLQSILFSHVFIFILLLSTANSAKSPKKRLKCDVDRCSQYFYSLLDMTRDVDKRRQLSSHRDCLMSMSDVCRGNLLYHTSVHVNEKKLKKLDRVQILNSHSTGDDGIKASNSGRTNQCMYAGKPKFKLCSLFGDPHVRTFSDKCHTCKANGSWPLISNDYLVVKATNSFLKGQLQATAISKLVVTIRRSGECAKEKTYLAETGSELSTTFTDGTTFTGLEKSVNVSVRESGKEIQINMRFIATTIVIRNVGSHLTFSVQMPEKIVDSPVDRRHQMCVRGCPKRQRIRLKQEITRLTTKQPEKDFEIDTKYSEHDARRRCRDVLLDRNEEAKELVRDREKRSVGKKTLNTQHRRDTEVDASVESWRQLSRAPGSGGRSRSPSRSKKNKNRQRSSSSRRGNLDPTFLQDDPGVGSFRGNRASRKDRDRGVISSISRGTNFYFEACVFDLMTTGDLTYASSARGAFDDVTRFHRSGGRAKGASRKAINSYRIVSTTSQPPISYSTVNTNATKRTMVSYPTTTTGNGSDPISINISLLIFCLLSTTYIFNFIDFKLIFHVYNAFFNQQRGTT